MEKLLWAKHWGSWASRTIKDSAHVEFTSHCTEWPVSMSVGWFRLLLSAGSHRWWMENNWGEEAIWGAELELAALSVRMESESQQCGKLRERERLERGSWGQDPWRETEFWGATEQSGGKCRYGPDIIAWAQSPACRGGGSSKPQFLHLYNGGEPMYHHSMILSEPHFLTWYRFILTRLTDSPRQY